MQERYNIRRNLLIKFSNDTIDQSAALTKILEERFPEMVTAQTLAGTHTTPLGARHQMANWNIFHPL